MDNKFKSIQDASIFLKQQLEHELMQQVLQYGKAILILPGGNSIKLFYPCLLNLDIPWQQVVVALSDERCVPVNHEMSNEKQLKESLLNFIPLHKYRSLNQDLMAEIQIIPPITVLSMGNDGHVASLFPTESQYWKQGGIEIYKTKNQKPNRISLSEKALLLSSKMYLLIVGKEKNQLLNQKCVTVSQLSSIYKNSIWIRC